MEINIDKIKKELERTTGRCNHVYLDNESDPEYIYVCFSGHYIVRIPAVYTPEQVLDMFGRGYGGDYIRPFHGAESFIDNVMTSKEEKVFTYTGIEERVGVKYAVFTYGNGEKAFFNPKFFKTYFKGLMGNDGTMKAKNILFTGIDAENPMVLWENDEAIALFLPVKVK